MELERILKQKVQQINSDERLLAGVKNWIDDCFGIPKIVTLVTPDNAYHLILTKENGAELREGDYGAFTLSYHGTEENILKLLNGELHATSAWKEEKLRIWGGLNEAFHFEKLL